MSQPAKGETVKVHLCKYPYPYRAMFTICNDLDETPDYRVYLEIMRYLNTSEPTSMGRGVDLEIANSLFFWPTYTPPNEFTYWDTDDAGRAMVKSLIRSGHIDTLHSFGHLARTREQAQRALTELEDNDCRLKVWVDHASDPHNFGPDLMKGVGDVPGAEAYHADLTLEYGIRYVWRGRVSSVCGQGVSPSLRGIFSSSHPLGSIKTVCKEAAKRCLGVAGSERYAQHADNSVLRAVRLRDGSPVYEFLRCNPHWRGTQYGATAAGIADVLNDAFLNRLTQRQGVCILYTHLGKVESPDRLFGKRTCRAFEGLARRFHNGEILVATTARLLDYLCMSKRLQWSSGVVGNTAIIDIQGIDDHIDGFRIPTVAELGGLSFVVRGVEKVEVRLAGRDLSFAENVVEDGQVVASLPFGRLEFPSL